MRSARGEPSTGLAARWRAFVRGLDMRAVADLVLLLDVVLIVLPGIVLAATYVAGRLDVPDTALLYAGPLAIFATIAILSMRARGLYAFDRLADFPRCVGGVAISLLLALAGLALVGFVLQVADDYSRVWAVGWTASALVTVLLGRALVARMIGRATAAGYVFHAAAIYGAPKQAYATAERLRRAGVGIVGVFGPDRRAGGPTREAALEALVTAARTERVDAIVIAGSAHTIDDMEETVAALSDLPVAVQLSLVSERDGLPLFRTASGGGLGAYDVQSPPIGRWGRFAKLLFDRVAAAGLLLALSPLLVVVALAIRRDGAGPVFFLQERHGFNQRIFRVWKFRTMSVQESGSEARPAERNDARVTGVGALLRRTSIDELPQLINVLRGEMSLVGPRPHPLNMDSRYGAIIERYAGRHKVKPGITGLAQINGLRGPVDDDTMRQRLEYDLRYIETWSFWQDLRILAATPFLGIVGKNAF